MTISTAELLAPQTIRQAISQLDLPGTSLQDLFGWGLGGANVGRQSGRNFAYDTFDIPRTVAHGRVPKQASGRLAPQHVGHVQGTFPRSAESIVLYDEDLMNRRAIGGPAAGPEPPLGRERHQAGVGGRALLVFRIAVDAVQAVGAIGEQPAQALGVLPRRRRQQRRPRQAPGARGQRRFALPRLEGVGQAVVGAHQGLAPELGSQNALLGGGRYDGMVEELGGPKIPAIGFAAGMERLLLAMGPSEAKPATSCFIAPLGAKAADAALVLSRELRGRGVRTEADTRGGSLKSLLRRADSLGARVCLVLGDTELERGVVAVKDLAARSQEEVARPNVVERVTSILATPAPAPAAGGAS